MSAEGTSVMSTSAAAVLSGGAVAAEVACAGNFSTKSGMVAWQRRSGAVSAAGADLFVIADDLHE